MAGEILSSFAKRIIAVGIPMEGVAVRQHNRIIDTHRFAGHEEEKPRLLYSLSKSFTSTAVGMARAEGLLTLEDRVLDYFPEQAPAHPSENLQKLKIKDLLCMASGHVSDPLFSDDSQEDRFYHAVEKFFAAPLVHEPGAWFLYNNGCTYLLSIIVQKVCGQTVRDYLMERLFIPIGIDNPYWALTCDGYNQGATGLYLSTTDITKFGQLYLQKGVWEGKRLIDPSYLELATTKRIDTSINRDSVTYPNGHDWHLGYGYQFWMCDHGYYRGDGAHGQYCIVMDDKDAVVAINTEDSNENYQGLIDAVWEEILPRL